MDGQLLQLVLWQIGDGGCKVVAREAAAEADPRGDHMPTACEMLCHVVVWGEVVEASLERLDVVKLCLHPGPREDRHFKLELVGPQDVPEHHHNNEKNQTQVGEAVPFALAGRRDAETLETPV